MSKSFKLPAFVFTYKEINVLPTTVRVLDQDIPLRCFLSLAFTSCIFFLPNLCHAVQLIPGEEQAGFFYVVTHLHPISYLVLLLIFVLSVLNLLYQARGAGKIGLNPFTSMIRKAAENLANRSIFTGWTRRSLVKSLEGMSRGSGRFRMVRDPASGNAIVGTPRMNETATYDKGLHSPTPLEGLNHPMPQFFVSSENPASSPRIIDRKLEKKPVTTEFKFSSAVDLPSPEEKERREKEQLVVSGFVKGLDSKGISSALIYLTDLDDNRVGQSFRSDPDTGEFRVIAHEPGKYILKAYKRDFVMEESHPPALPIESGKIEGYNLRMLPEGCVLQGKVAFDNSNDSVAGLEVKCVCLSDDFSRTTHTDPEGHFVISSVPPNSECFLEVLTLHGDLLLRSEPFETVQKKEIYREVKIVSNLGNHDSASAEAMNSGIQDTAEP
ncbi:MAG: carboxypeptidase-like regulatory domain-containing protein [Desulfomonile sp.]